MALLPTAAAAAPNPSLTGLDLDSGDLDKMSIEEVLDVVVVSATKLTQTIEQAPSIMEVVSREEIVRNGYRTVGEALRSVPGLHAIDDLVFTSVGVRGIFSDSSAPSDIIKLMINGQPVAFRSMSANFFGHDLVPIEVVRQIEIIRGPSSALYGANAFLGVINIVTFDGSEIEPGSRSSGGVVLNGSLSDNRHRTNLSGDVSLRGAYAAEISRFLVAATYRRANRSGLELPGTTDMVRAVFHREHPELYPVEKKYPSPGRNGAQRATLLYRSPSRRDLERVGSFYGIGSVDVGKAMQVVADSSFQYFDRNGEFQEYSTLMHNNRVAFTNWYARMRLIYDPLSLSSESSSERSQHREDEGFGFEASLAVAGGGPTDSDHIVPNIAGLRTIRHFGYTAVDGAASASYAFSRNHTLTLGLDMSRDREQTFTIDAIDLRTGKTTASAPDLPDHNYDNYGGFLQWVVGTRTGLTLTMGARVEHNSMIACKRGTFCRISQPDRVIVPQGPWLRPITISDRGLLRFSNRAAIVYTDPEGRFYTKATYGSSFKPPSPYQLYHENTNGVGTIGNPALRPQTAHAVEVQLGARWANWFHASVNAFHTSVFDKVVFVKEELLKKGRNADVSIVGVEGVVDIRTGDWLSAYANVTAIPKADMRMKRGTDDTDFTWSTSQFNATLPAGMFPKYMVKAGVRLLFAERHCGIGLSGAYVGERLPSMVNRQLYKPMEIESTYVLPDYFTFDVAISLTGLQAIEGRETRVSAGAKNIPGGYIEPGFGGIDIPSLGPQVFMLIAQEL